MKLSQEPSISAERIALEVQRLAAELDADYDGKSPTLVGVLKGSFIFLADLVRAMRIDIGAVEFVRAASYGASTTSDSSAEPAAEFDMTTLEGRHVIIVEDIIDSGLTASRLIGHMERFAPASLRLCALLDKPSRRQVTLLPDYVGFTVPDRFLVGYGLDYDQRYRELPDVYELVDAPAQP